jgi:phage terminase large subunit GpA-like protein
MTTIDLPLLQAGCSYWKPPKKLKLSEWADEYAVLSAESSAESGRWHSLPYQRGVMDAFTDPTVETVVWQKSARVGATKIFNHVIGYHVHQDPCAMMVVQPTVEDSEGFSKDEIAPMLRDTPVLQPLIVDPKQKDGSNTILLKQFKNGAALQMVGANSARGFRRVSRRIVLFDEVDGYPPSTPEGDQIKLGIKRSEYFWNRKIGLISTPTIKGFSRIEKWFEMSDQRRYFVPCPHCNHYQVLRWTQMKWEKDADGNGLPDTAAYECENCQELIPHSMKRWMVERGEWRPTTESKRPGLVGFHIWAAYSYSPNAGWSQLVQEFLEVKNDRTQLQTFINTLVGEVFEDEYASSLSSSGLAVRREEYPPGHCPAGVVLLTAGVDVQDNRLAVSVWGWGAGEESWLVWHQEIMGQPTQPQVWEQLDAVLDTAWPVEGGGELKLAQMAIDSGGHATHEVYQYARERRNRYVVPIKGSSRRNQAVINKGTPQDVNWKGKMVKRGVVLYQVGTDTVKTTLFGRLRHNNIGPGYVHFGQSGDDEWCSQVTSEKQQLRYVKGFPVREWVKSPSARNEALDCMVYAYAALQLVARRYSKATMWEQLADRLKQRKTGSAAPTTPTPIPRRRGTWLSKD